MDPPLALVVGSVVVLLSIASPANGDYEQRIPGCYYKLEARRVVTTERDGQCGPAGLSHALLLSLR